MSNISFIDSNYDWKIISLQTFLKEGNTPEDWVNFFEKKEVTEEIKNISSFLLKNSQEVRNIYPQINLVFRSLYLTPLNKVKVVILGQDPYHNGSAVGICFSVLPGNSINPSLQNIYRELSNEGYDPKKDGILLNWCKQGCLMLNTAFTVEKGNPESHVAVWYNFSEMLIDYISRNTKDVAWILMGSKALAFRKNIFNEEQHFIVVTSHPSPFSANRGFRGHSSFIGSGIFRKVNQYLEKKGKERIKW